MPAHGARPNGSPSSSAFSPASARTGSCSPASPVYYPWRLFEWWYVYDAYAPDIFQTGGTIAGGGGIVASLSAIIGSVWRARQAKHVTTYGSAR